MRNKQGCDLTGVLEMWWDNSNDYGAVMDGYKLFTKDQAGQ